MIVGSFIKGYILRDDKKGEAVTVTGAWAARISAP
jgi:hypothetical protein